MIAGARWVGSAGAQGRSPGGGVGGGAKPPPLPQTNLKWFFYRLKPLRERICHEFFLNSNFIPKYGNNLKNFEMEWKKNLLAIYDTFLVYFPSFGVSQIDLSPSFFTPSSILKVDPIIFWRHLFGLLMSSGFVDYFFVFKILSSQNSSDNIICFDGLAWKDWHIKYFNLKTYTQTWKLIYFDFLVFQMEKKIGVEEWCYGWPTEVKEVSSWSRRHQLSRLQDRQLAYNYLGFLVFVERNIYRPRFSLS